MNIEILGTKYDGISRHRISKLAGLGPELLFGFWNLRFPCLRAVIVLLLAFLTAISTCWAHPKRLIIDMDGISYRDMKALQQGVVYTNFWGLVRRKAFSADDGYFPVSRMISTFPSTSDVAWTDIFGNRPLPGYQRTYYSVAANSEFSVNGLTSTMEHERQMYWQSQSDFTRSMGYLYSEHVYELEVHEMLNNFWATDDTNANYYAYIRSSDDAQHMDRDVYSLLCLMDRKLQELRVRYRASEGHDLQILILSDHGHNHAGRGERVQINSFLETAGYRVAQSIQNSNDVVLPTSGIEDWIEIHNAPSETERLAEKLTRLKGVDVLAARLPGPSNHILVLNSRGERASIEWNATNHTYSYSAVTGDPLNYGPVTAALGREGKLDAQGFATADDWMSATLTNHYPLALQRIVRGLTSVTLNPATILVSLDNHYVHADALINDGSMLVPCGSTHGALDDINSMGVVLSNFAPTHDTSTDRVAACFDGFAGLRNFRAEESDAEWVCKSEQARARIRRDPFDWNYQSLPANQIFLRVWSPDLADAGADCALQASVVKVSGLNKPQSDPPVSLQPSVLHEQNYTFSSPVSFPQKCPYERIYPCPADMTLEPQSSYRIAGWVWNGKKNVPMFEFVFQTDGEGRPAAF